MILKIWPMINYWYMRYLLVTELFMVEKWERVMIHTVFLFILTMLSIFNWKIVVGMVSLFIVPSIEDKVSNLPSEVIS